MGLAGFDFEGLNRRFMAAGSLVHLALGYNVLVRPVSTSGWAWRCIGIYHLLPDENRGRRNVFIDVLDERGRRVRQNVAIKWQWADDGPVQLRKLDKPDSEPAADIPIDKGASITLSVDDGILTSDVVTGISSNHTDEGVGNTRFHHSFYVVFALLRSAVITPPVIDPPVVPPSNAAILAQLDVVQAELAKLRRMLQ